MRLIKGILLILASSLAIQSAFADSLYTFSSVNQTFTDPNTLGFAFSVNSNFTVTSLGWFDVTQSGFQDAHTVGLFNASGQLLTSITLSAGNVDPLAGFFRYAAIAPITLSAGTTYVLAGTSGSDAYTENDAMSGFAINPNFIVTANAALYAPNTSELVFPDQHFSDYMVYAGPNLDGIPLSDAPEPGSLPLLFAGCIALLLLRRRFGKGSRRIGPSLV